MTLKLASKPQVVWGETPFLKAMAEAAVPPDSLAPSDHVIKPSEAYAAVLEQNLYPATEAPACLGDVCDEAGAHTPECPISNLTQAQADDLNNPRNAERCEIPDCPSAHGELEDPRVNHVTLARSADTDVEYVNVQHHHIGAQYTIMKALHGTDRGNVMMTFWSEVQNDWLKCEVHPSYRLTTAPEYLARAARPAKASAETRRARAAHLAPFRKQKAEIEPAPSQPDKCIVGQIGAFKVLVDAGDGTVLGKFEPQGFVPAAEAQKLGRTLVGQKDATLYAMTLLRRAWAEAKGAK